MFVFRMGAGIARGECMTKVPSTVATRRMDQSYVAARRPCPGLCGSVVMVIGGDLVGESRPSARAGNWRPLSVSAGRSKDDRLISVV